MLTIELALEGEGGGGAALQRRAAAALARQPTLAPAGVAGRLRVAVTVAERPWPGNDGTGKRRLLDERPQERS